MEHPIAQGAPPAPSIAAPAKDSPPLTSVTKVLPVFEHLGHVIFERIYNLIIVHSENKSAPWSSTVPWLSDGYNGDPSGGKLSAGGAQGYMCWLVVRQVTRTALMLLSLGVRPCVFWFLVEFRAPQHYLRALLSLQQALHPYLPILCPPTPTAAPLPGWWPLNKVCNISGL